MTAATLCACNSQQSTPNRTTTVDLTSIKENKSEITRVEPLSWWIGMKTPLQLMIQGDDISSWSVSLAEQSDEISIKKVTKADNPNFLFADIEIGENAKAAEYNLLFTKGQEQFKYGYSLENRREGSAQRKSFTTADMIYLIMPDRFANGDESNDSTSDTADKLNRDELFGRHGGDIQGIINNLDYIAELGATAIWSTPLLLDDEQEHSYHGYACSDYYKIDPRYGSNELYRTLVSEGHKRGLKTIMDIVTNHCGAAHWWMKDMPFNDWVHKFDSYTGTNHFFSTNMDTNASKFDLGIQERGWFVESMPDMNLNNPYLLQYFKQWAIWWIEYANLDGLEWIPIPTTKKSL